MFSNRVESPSFTVQNYQIQTDEIFNAFRHNEYLFFFYPSGLQKVIEYAVKITLDDLTQYDPLRSNRDLLSMVVQDIDLYLSRYPNPQLEDYRFMECIEIACAEIEECVNHFVRDKLPMNHQIQTGPVQWVGNTVMFALRIF